MDEKEISLRKIQERIDLLESAKKKLNHVPISLVLQAFPEIQFSFSATFCEMEFVCPMSFSLIESIKLFVKEQLPDWKLYFDNQYVWSESKSAGRFVKYEFETSEGKAYLEFSFRSTTQGSACVLNKIGEQTKVVPIYEVVCSQQAADEFGVV